MLLCLVVYLTLLASFFLLSLKHVQLHANVKSQSMNIKFLQNGAICIVLYIQFIQCNGVAALKIDATFGFIRSIHAGKRYKYIHTVAQIESISKFNIS